MSLVNKSWLKTQDGGLWRVNDLTNFRISLIRDGVIISENSRQQLWRPVVMASNKYTEKDVVIKLLPEKFTGVIEDVIQEILTLPVRKEKR
jgi:hypothetical protein